MDPYQYIKKFNKFGGEGGFKPGLKRVEYLLSALGNPQKKLEIIHVAGTNGKGSTIEILKSIYSRADYKVGVYTSPHLINFNERMKINDREITTEELKELVQKIAPLVKEMSNKKIGKPTYFELVTVLALQFFALQNVDLVLLEVGLGGRLDATNVIKKPLVSVITSIDREHTEILGDTISDIAREKAGIIKEETPVITGVRKDEALTVIKEIAEEKTAEYINIDKLYNYKILNSNLNGQEFTITLNESANSDKNMKPELQGKFKVGLLGEYQVRNSVLALTIIDRLSAQYPVNRAEIRKGLLAASWAGRLEIVNRRPLLILDGAHNSAGMEQFSSFLKEKIPDSKKINFIFAVLADKNIKEMLGYIKRIDHDLQLILTKNNNDRSISVDQLEKEVKDSGLYYRKYDNLQDAIIATLNRMTSDEVLCISGSLYTVAEAKQILSESSI